MSVVANDNDDDNDNPNNYIFAMKDTKLYVPVVILSAKGKQKLSQRYRYISWSTNESCCSFGLKCFGIISYYYICVCNMRLHPLSIIKTTKYFNYEPRFNCVFSRNNLRRIKVGIYIINLDHKKNKGAH